MGVFYHEICMIVIRYNRTPETTKDLVVIEDELSHLHTHKVTSADTFEIAGAIFAVVSRKYDFSSNTLIIYVK